MNPEPSSRSRLLLIAVALPLAAATACERARDVAAPAPPSAQVAPTSVAIPSPVASTSATPPTLPDSGEFELTADGGVVTMAANEAPRVRVLRALAKSQGFALKVARIPRETVTAQIAGASPEQVIATLAGPHRHELHYDFDAEAGEPRLAKVRIGRWQDGATARKRIRERLASPEDDGAEDREASAAPRASAARLGPPADPVDVLAADDTRRAPRRVPGPRSAPRRDRGDAPAESTASLEDAEPALRAEAVQHTELNPEGVARLTTLLTEDPAVEVRAAIAEKLAAETSFSATSALLAALHDPAPRVVIEAIDSLVYQGDASLAPQIAPLEDHEDPEVRAAASDALAFFE